MHYRRQLQVATPAGHNETLKHELPGSGTTRGSSRTSYLCQLHRPVVFFLSETIFFMNSVDGLIRALGYANGFGVGSFGRGGGLAFLWNQEVSVKLYRCDKLHIDVAVLDPATQEAVWRFTGFYGESRKELRHQSWDYMKLLKGRSSLSWICARDFNEVLDASEQFGGLVRPERQMRGFQDVVMQCGYADLGYIGLPFTWDNRQSEGRNVKVRLDRALATSGLIDLFDEVRVWHVQMTESDHCMLVIECVKQHDNRKKNHSFRYKNMW